MDVIVVSDDEVQVVEPQEQQTKAEEDGTVYDPRLETTLQPLSRDGENDKDGEGGDRPDGCPICLGPFNDKTLLNVCFHGFCNACILIWSEVTRHCPLCKQGFTSLIHNIKSDVIFEQTFLDPPTGTRSSTAGNGASSSRFRYRTTHNFGGSSCRVPASVDRRRVVYAAGLWVRPETDPELVRKKRSIDLKTLQADQRARLRLETWLDRELQILCGPEHADFVKVYIMSVLGKVEIRGFGKLLRPFLFRHTNHFVHEFINFAQSPLDMASYDRRARYISAEEGSGRPRRTRKGALTSNSHDTWGRSSMDTVPDCPPTPPHMPEYARAVRDMRSRSVAEPAKVNRDVSAPISIPCANETHHHKKRRRKHRKTRRREPSDHGSHSASPPRQKTLAELEEEARQLDQGLAEAQRELLRMKMLKETQMAQAQDKSTSD